MKYFYKLCFLVLLSQLAFSQETGNQKSTGNPATANFDQISFDSDGFKIYFPSTPKRNTRPADQANFKEEIVQYISGGMNNTYIVQFADFPTVLDEQSATIRFRLAKQSLLKYPDTRLIKETPVAFTGYYWNDIVTEGDDGTHFTRTLIARQRLFQIFYIAHEKLSNATLQAKEHHEKEAEKFFASFSILKLPEAKLKALEQPSDFKIRIEKGIFYSDHLGFSINLPKNWKILAQKEMRQAYEAGRKSVEPNPIATFDEAKQGILLALLKEDRIQDNVMALSFTAEKTEYPDFKPDQAMKALIKRSIANDLKATGVINVTKIGGKDFAWTEMPGGTGNPKQRTYMGNVKGMIFTISFMYKNPKNLPHLLNLLKTVVFSE